MCVEAEEPRGGDLLYALAVSHVALLSDEARLGATAENEL